MYAFGCLSEAIQAHDTRFGDKVHKNRETWQPVRLHHAMGWAEQCPATRPGAFSIQEVARHEETLLRQRQITGEELFHEPLAAVVDVLRHIHGVSPTWQSVVDIRNSG